MGAAQPRAVGLLSPLPTPWEQSSALRGLCHHRGATGAVAQAPALQRTLLRWFQAESVLRSTASVLRRRLDHVSEPSCCILQPRPRA